MTTYRRFALALLLVPTLSLLALSASAQSSDANRYSIGIGGGLVDDGNNEETYLLANFRFPVKRTKSAFNLFLEPEIGHWEFDEPFGRDDLFEGEVTNVGLNFLAIAEGRRFDVWAGIGIGAYIEEFTIRGGGVGVVRDDSETNLGGNLQVGVDLNLGPRVAIWLLGRIDFVDTDIFDEQQKLLIGLRFRFGN